MGENLNFRVFTVDGNEINCKTELIDLKIEDNTISENIFVSLKRLKLELIFSHQVKIIIFAICDG